MLLLKLLKLDRAGLMFTDYHQEHLTYHTVTHLFTSKTQEAVQGSNPDLPNCNNIDIRSVPRRALTTSLILSKKASLA